MSAIVPAPEVHYFAGPGGYVFEATYTPHTSTVAGFWGTNLCAGALGLPIDERVPVMHEACAFAREEWPNVGGTVRIDHKGHRA